MTNKGVRLRAVTVYLDEKSLCNPLLTLGGWLVDYGKLPTSQRGEAARKIEKAPMLFTSRDVSRKGSSLKERAQDASVTLESSELTRRVLLILTAPQLRGGLTRSASTRPPSGFLEVVNLNERDAGNVVLPADDSGVIAREERQKDGRFAIIGRSQPGIDQRLFLRQTAIVLRSASYI